MARLRVVTVSPAIQVLDPCGCFPIQRRTTTSLVADHQNASNVKAFNEIPGPKPWPIIGNAWRFIPVIGEFGVRDTNKMLNHVRQKYGRICRISKIPIFNDMVYIFDANDVETMYRNEGTWPNRPGIRTIPYYREVLRKDVFKDVLGVGFSQGKAWYEFRSKVNQTMMQPRNAKMYVGPIDEVTKDFIERVRSLRNDEGELPTDFIQHLLRWALESISLIALDTRLGCLDPELKSNSEPQKMIDNANFLFEAIVLLDFTPIPIHFSKRKLWKDFVKALDVFNEVAMKYIDRAMQRIQDKVKGDVKDMSVLETLLIKNENPMIATVMALDMLLAGIDTTSHSSAVVLHHLARNVDKQEKLFEELKAILPDKGQAITAQNLEQMKYLKACIKESLRLSPIASGIARETTKDIVLSNYHVPKGTFVIAGHMVMGKEEQHFPQPDVFMPERWIKGGDEEQKPNPFVFLPFGFGPRMCIGRRFAELEMETLVANVIRNFRIQYDQELTFKPMLVNTVSSPLNFRVEDRT